MKVNKFLKNIFKSLVFISPIALSVSCSSSNNSTNKLEMIKNSIVKTDSSKEQEWNTFINQKYIQVILDRSFNSKEEKEKFIESQKSISDEYINKIKIASRFGNNIISEFDDGGGFLFLGNVKNLITYKSIDIKEELYSKNWLFFLFNIHRFNFFHFSDIEPDKAFKEDFIESLETNKKIFEDFYTPKKLNIIDLAVQEYDLSETSSETFEVNEENTSNKPQKTKEVNYNFEDRIYFLSEEGYIYFVRLFGTKKVTSFSDGTKKEEQTINKVYLNQYLYSFPKLVASKDKMNDFDLKKYIDVVAPWENSKLGFRDAIRILFIEEYGGETFRYTLIDA
ncbi:aromatic motif membrane protein [Mycoplasma sp. OR1901]|uniref:aromatic motif membrane protein n=1 Tax=Mycoplasma sp. OR1901 TaxID=2742195 RepID=UPI0015836F2B|nr:aromatic motif membrane protein [Mycoplasma sp. OR1901]QKT05131.1 hypothetical protein HTZ87_00145 [Mycoplasma sp. OR1901]